MQSFISLKFLAAVLTCLLLFGARFAIGGAAKPAWQGEWEKSIQEAEKEGAVTFYSNSGYGFVNDFQERFPKIKVNVVEARAGELISRIMTERRADKYVLDIAKLGNTSSYTLYQSKALQPISSTFLLPEVRDESKWWQGKHQYADPEGKYIFVPFGSVYIQMVSYNSDLVRPFEFKSYWHVLDARWRGKIAVIDPRGPGAREGARLVYYHPELGPKFLTRLMSEMEVTLSRDYRQAVDWLAQGKFAFLFFCSSREVLEAKEKGLPVNILNPSMMKESGGLDAGASTFVLMDKPAHPNAAKVFVNWFLSRDGQIAAQKNDDKYDSLRIDIPKGEIMPLHRRVEGAKYLLLWTPEWMDMKPVSGLVDEILSGANQKAPK
jgi:iron(III) transport system substrate-binding protein